MFNYATSHCYEIEVRGSTVHTHHGPMHTSLNTTSLTIIGGPEALLQHVRTSIKSRQIYGWVIVAGSFRDGVKHCANVCCPLRSICAC